jgi:CRP-like cAMP-binding protein
MWPGINHRGNSATQDVPGVAALLPEAPDKLALLSAMDIFQDLSEEQIAVLMDRSPMRTARKGTMIYGADGPEVLFLLKSGRAELFRLSPDGKKLTLAIVEQGTFLGEMSLIGLQLEGTFATATEDSVICALSHHDVESLILEHPRVGLRIIQALARRLQETRNSLQEMIFNDVTGRVAALLLNLADQHTNEIKGYSHQDLAAMVGCLRESFTTVLDRFKRSNAVATGRKRIQITDRAQLERIVLQRSGVLPGPVGTYSERAYQ